MKRIEASIQPHRLDRVIAALHALDRFPGFTVLAAHGQGHGRGAGGHYAFGEDGVLFHERRLLVVICEDAETAAICKAIRDATHTGARGDGIIAVSEVVGLMRIGDGGGRP